MTNTNVGMHPGASENLPGTSATHPAASANHLVTSANMLPQRKNIRAEFHDYSGGDYFITICTRDKSQYFGKIINGEMIFSEIGNYADQAMRTLHTHYSYVEVPLYVIMPNHVHAIISIRENADAPGSIPTIRTALGVVVGGFKQNVTRYARRNNITFGWQSRYHDHIIRGIRDGNMIANYIENNVAQWAKDCFNVGMHPGASAPVHPKTQITQPTVGMHPGASENHPGVSDPAHPKTQITQPNVGMHPGASENHPGASDTHPDASENTNNPVQ